MIMFTREEELEHLKKRLAELKTISCNLQDIFDWFVKYQNKMHTNVHFEDLPDAIDEIDVTVSDIEYEIDVIKEEIEATE